MTYYRRLFEESPAPLFIYDRLTYAFLAVNEMALRQYGYTRKEFLALRVDQIRPEEDRDAFLVASERDTPSCFDFGIWRHRRKDGSLFHAHVYTSSTVFEGREARSVCAINVEEKVEAEREIARKNEEIRSILESITDGFMTLDRNWNITYINQAAERILRRDRGAVMGYNIWELFPEARNSSFHRHYNHALQHRVTVQFKEYYAPLDLWTSVNVYPTPDGLAVYLVDVTEQERHIEQIRRQNQKLKEIAWIQSHEVRGPLSNILGLTALFNQVDVGDPINSQVLEMVQVEAEKLDVMVRKISQNAGEEPII